MNFNRKVIACLAATACASILFSCSKDDDDPPPVNAYAVTLNSLLSFNIGSPSTATAKVITGMQAGENIEGADVRPANGELYVLTAAGRLYKVDVNTAVAALVSAAPVPVLNGSSFGMDFNPMADRIRVVSNTDQNLRINPDLGTTAALDTDINPANPAINAVAYTNNKAGATSTDLYYIDPATDQLYKANGSPNGGNVIPVGPLGVNADGHAGFDISGTDNKAFAVLTVNSVAKFYSINLTTGAATLVGDLPFMVRGLALKLDL